MKTAQRVEIIAIHKSLITNRHQFKIAESSHTDLWLFLIIQTEQVPKLMAMRPNSIKCAYGLSSPALQGSLFTNLLNKA
ncbi:MAG: hypothetical protein ONB46_26215 [candidate division KSB1 bacterium]|nr:hypothetical protein [candidate division KSB1 bacterium]MDZ7369444.1 hypothetical protein [candidate division KSB1 bacterium]MDZ7407521.1 hypothetical protein [candidate division KSB1 bacterium]